MGSVISSNDPNKKRIEKLYCKIIYDCTSCIKYNCETCEKISYPKDIFKLFNEYVNLIKISKKKSDKYIQKLLNMIAQHYKLFSIINTTYVVDIDVLYYYFDKENSDAIINFVKYFNMYNYDKKFLLNIITTKIKYIINTVNNKKISEIDMKILKTYIMKAKDFFSENDLKCLLSNMSFSNDQIYQDHDKSDTLNLEKYIVSII